MIIGGFVGVFNFEVVEVEARPTLQDEPMGTVWADGFEEEFHNVMEQETELPKKELINVLKKRMVKGEIDLDTYREMKAELER